MTVSIQHYISILISLLIVIGLAISSNRKVKSSEDFSLGGRQMSASKVAGIIIGTLVGGASTIGTAQLAYQRGINAMWFTLGASLACIFLGLFLAKPLRKAEVDTVTQFIARNYGPGAGIAASILTSLAIFVHITGQFLSSIAIFSSLFEISLYVALVITIVLIISNIFFGGVLGSSIVGVVKTVLLYLTLGISGLLAIKYFGGVRSFLSAFPKEPWFNLFSQGIGDGFAEGFALVIGVSSTQTYLQALFSGKTERESRMGSFLSAILIPPIGAACTLIGMYMRTVNPDLVQSEVLPTFILNYLSPWIGGIAIAGLIISVIGTGAGLTLGVCTMINRDIYLRFINPEADDKAQLRVLRLSVFGVLTLVLLLVFTNAESLILKWGFLSMTLRGTTIFVPLIGAIFLKDRIRKEAGLASIILAPIITLLWELFGSKNIDSLYIGVIASFIIITLLSIYPVKQKDNPIA